MGIKKCAKNTGRAKKKCKKRKMLRGGVMCMKYFFIHWAYEPMGLIRLVQMKAFRISKHENCGKGLKFERYKVIIL